MFVLLALCIIFRILPESKTRTNESRVDEFNADWLVELDRVGTKRSGLILRFEYSIAPLCQAVQLGILLKLLRVLGRRVFIRYNVGCVV